MDMKPQVAWAMVVIVFVMMAGAVTLRIFGEDISIIITLVTVLAVPVLAGFGIKVHENLQEIKTQTNGKNDKQMEINQKQYEMFHEVMQQNNNALLETVRQLQEQVTTLALQMTPPIPVETLKELSDNTSPVHIPR